MTYTTWITNTNDDCWHRLPCGMCRLTKQICPKHINTSISYTTCNTGTSQTAVGKPDENISIKVTGETE